MHFHHWLFSECFVQVSRLLLSDKNSNTTVQSVTFLVATGDSLAKGTFFGMVTLLSYSFKRKPAAFEPYPAVKLLPGAMAQQSAAED